MTSSDQPLRVAIFGVHGIGRVHARIFQALGTDVCAVLGSIDTTAVSAAQDLSESFGIQARPFSCLEDLLAEPLDAVSICTPAHLHFEQTMAAFERGLPVFCEKPLFWDESYTLTEIVEKLRILEAHPNRRLFVNTSNTVFVDAVRDRIPSPEKTRTFYLRFHTQGSYKGKDIGVDLFPHGLSLLFSVLGRRELTSFDWNSTETTYRCSFAYGQCKVTFDFQEIPGGPKALAFRIDDRGFYRIQAGSETTYRAYLADMDTGERLAVPDPFEIYISRFIQSCKVQATPGEDEFDQAAANLRLMAQNLIIGANVD